MAKLESRALANTPLHWRIRDYLEQEIRSGGFQAGDRLPPEPELMRRFDASRGTVRKAYDALVHIGLVERNSGKGSFVRDTAEHKKIDEIHIGVVVPSMSMFEEKHNPTNWRLSVETLNGILSAAMKANVQIEVIPHFTDPGENGEFDGYLFLGSHQKVAEAVSILKNPCIVFSEGTKSNIKNTVAFDLVGSFSASYEFLIAKGFKRIAYVGGFDETRFETFKQTLKNNGLQFDQKRCEASNIGTISDGFEAGKRLLARTRDFDVVFCVTDLRAFGVINALNEAGLNVPRDVSVMGFDNILQASRFTPPLTTYETPRVAGGMRALEELVKMIENPGYQSGRMIEKGRIIERKSVGSPP